MSCPTGPDGAICNADEWLHLPGAHHQDHSLRNEHGELIYRWPEGFIDTRPPNLEPEPDTGIRTACKLPPGAIALHVVELCEYLEADGRHAWSLRADGDNSFAPTIGLLEMAKHSLLRSNAEQEGL